MIGLKGCKTCKKLEVFKTSIRRHIMECLIGSVKTAMQDYEIMKLKRMVNIPFMPCSPEWVQLAYSASSSEQE